MSPELFRRRLQALRAPRPPARDKLARVDDDPARPGKERLATVFKALLDYVVGLTDDKDKPLCAPLLTAKTAQGKEPLCDFSSVEGNISARRYDSPAQFDADMNAMFSAVTREHGRMSTLGAIAVNLKKEYNAAKAEFVDLLNKILGPDDQLPAGFLQKAKQEEVIMCICGLHVEEGLMVQCGSCGVWQHARCMRVSDTRAPHYCHHCPRTGADRPQVDREIPLEEWTEEGHQFYVSLMRGSLQVRQGDTVYVLRDIPIDAARPDLSAKPDEHKTKRPDRKLKNQHKGKDDAANKETSVRKHTYQTIGPISVSELDIFRVERLWKHKDTHERYVYGHHYLRPHETFHEPTRKFFHNEVMRVPLYEAVPIELVMSQCWVMDLNTYCKGRPVGARQEHVYICELRVDRGARLFTKISRPKYPICTKAYAFDHFPTRLKITRTYAPHEVSPEYLKGRAAKNAAPADKTKPSVKDNNKKKPAVTYPENRKNSLSGCGGDRSRQKERVNNIARRLLARGAGSRALDASYLLARRPAPRAP